MRRLPNLAFSLIMLCVICVLPMRIMAEPNLDSLKGYWQNESNPDSLRAHALDRIAASNWNRNIDSSRFYYELLFEFAEKSGNKYFKAKALNGYGTVESRKYNHESAIKYWFQTLKIFREINNPKGIAGCYINISQSFYVLGQLNTSLKYLTKGVRICEKHGILDYLSNGYNFIGFMLYTQKDYEDALEYMLKADSLNSYLGNADMYGLKSNIGIIYHELGELDKSKDILEKSLENQIDYDYGENIANTLMELGVVHSKLGEFNTALSYIDQAEIRASKLDNPRVLVNTLIIKGRIYFRMGDYTNAINSCSEAESAMPSLPIVEEEAMCSCLYDSYKEKGEGNQALKYLERLSEIKDTLTKKENAQLIQEAEFEKQLVQDSTITYEKERQIQLVHEEEMRQEEQQRNMAYVGGFIALLLAGGFFSRWRYVHKSKAVIEKEKDRSETLLHNILPEEVADELKATGTSEAKDFDEVTVLFTDFVEFTQTAEKLTAKELVNEINACFKAFDGIMEKYQLEKIKTIGDAYMAAGGLHAPRTSDPKDVIQAAIEMQAFMLKRKAQRSKQSLPAFDMRLGIHTGPVVAGIVGVKKFQYDIWGDTVNTASRMESHGEIGKVNISNDTYRLISKDSQFSFESRGKVQVKGKGEMEMWFVSRIEELRKS